MNRFNNLKDEDEEEKYYEFLDFDDILLTVKVIGEKDVKNIEINEYNIKNSYFEIEPDPRINQSMRYNLLVLKKPVNKIYSFLELVLTFKKINFLKKIYEILPDYVVNYRNGNRDTSLIIAVKIADIEIIDFLLEKDIKTINYGRRKPLEIALYNKNPEIVKLLLKKGASIDLKYINNTSEECKDIILNEIEIKTKMILKRLIDIDNVTKQDLIINILSFI
jgi:ankyrin repeat protein